MCNYSVLKLFTMNLNKVSRMLTNGKYNSSDIAIFNDIKGTPKTIEEIAKDINMSVTTVYSTITLNVRRKNVIALPDKVKGQNLYMLSEDMKVDILSQILEPLNQTEQKQFMEFIDRINDNMRNNILKVSD